MKYVLPKSISDLGSLGIVTCAAGGNALAGISGHLNETLANFIADCVGTEILQSVPVLASTSHGGLNIDSIATEVAATLIGSVLLAIAPSVLRHLRQPRARGSTDSRV
jgi:hypothetical protein